MVISSNTTQNSVLLAGSTYSVGYNIPVSAFVGGYTPVSSYAGSPGSLQLFYWNGSKYNYVTDSTATITINIFNALNYNYPTFSATISDVYNEGTRQSTRFTHPNNFVNFNK